MGLLFFLHIKKIGACAFLYFHALHQQTHKILVTHNIYPILHIEDLLDKLAHANWFSKMDLAQGYH